MGLALSSKSSLLSSSTANRIRAIDAHARHYGHDDGQFASVTPTTLGLLQQQPNRKLAAIGGGTGGTLHNLGLAVSTRSSLFIKTTADRIHEVEAKALGQDVAADLTPGLLPADLAAVGGRRHLFFKRQLQRMLMQGVGGFGGLGGGFGGGSNGGSSRLNPRDVTVALQKRKDDAAVTSMINQAVNGDMDVMSAVTARQQGSTRALEMSLGRDRQQQLNGNIAGRKLQL